MSLRSVSLSLLAALLTIVPGHAGSLLLSQQDVSLFDPNGQITTGTYAVRFGTFSSGTFTPFFGTSFSLNNTGYLDALNAELEAAITQSDNSVLSISQPYWVSVVLIGETEDYNDAEPSAVLTDPSWLIPEFTLISVDDAFFTASTTASRGSFDYNGGQPKITVVPEPSTIALLFAGLGAVAALRLRRRA